MNLSELKKEIAKHGERIDAEIARLKGEIERLEKGRKPLVWADIKDRPGTCFRLSHNTFRGLVIPGARRVWIMLDDGAIGFDGIMFDTTPVILQDNKGNDLPPEKQVKG